ncbi:MAG: AraC family transcriptional regulator [Caulobacteraceae bacterium]|nr:MAG: AraC family transcriptional regulator [Caulobacteraceae bacterium]
MDIGIDIDAVATTAGVSRATLYRAFDGEGGVNRFIQDRRLHHARAALRRRRAQSPTIADVAHDYGFASASHFSRLFRARYGYSPSEVEVPDTPQDISMSTGPIRHDVLGEWLADLKRA